MPATAPPPLPGSAAPKAKRRYDPHGTLTATEWFETNPGRYTHIRPATGEARLARIRPTAGGNRGLGPPDQPGTAARWS
jgi:hypothetical protein